MSLRVFLRAGFCAMGLAALVGCSKEPPGCSDPTTLNLLTRLTRKAVAVAGTPDAGIWEYRTEWRSQTFSSLMCWAAADRMSKVAERHGPQLVSEFAAAAASIRERILSDAWDERLGSLVASPDGGDLDASLLQAVTLRLLPCSDVRLRGTNDCTVPQSRGVS